MGGFIRRGALPTVVRTPYVIVTRIKIAKPTPFFRSCNLRGRIDSLRERSRSDFLGREVSHHNAVWKDVAMGLHPKCRFVVKKIESDPSRRCRTESAYQMIQPALLVTNGHLHIRIVRIVPGNVCAVCMDSVSLIGVIGRGSLLRAIFCDRKRPTLTARPDVRHIADDRN